MEKLIELIEQNMADENFGVSELADSIGMSRSNLLRKIKKLTGLSVSQLIRQARLEKAMELLKSGSLNVSEVSYRVGFGSVSYFVKCFREAYGYPPGEVGQRREVVETVRAEKTKPELKNSLLIVAGIFLVLLIVSMLVRPMSGSDESLEKSIAVLPFKNDSSDSTNVYLINGLMESTLNNLQKIGDLRVISRTSTEKYRESSKSAPEIAKELNVNYFVEGSGQKIGDRIMLNIQLIEASTDKHLWAAQYERDSKDIFKIQQEIASTIANEIKAIISPTAQRQITKIPTDNLLAYDNYLKGRNIFGFSSQDDVVNAVPYFKKAVELDGGFAEAYAALAVSYYYIDMFKAERKYVAEMNASAQKAFQLDPELPESQMAMALCERQKGRYDQAVEYLENALELSPNSAEVINMLSDIYANFLPNTEKYLEYALKGIQLSRGANDSLTTSYIYLHLSNALIQSGFVEESLYYVNRSLEYSEYNGFSNYVKAFMLFAQERDYDKLRERLIAEWQKDSSRLDILQEIGKVSYFMRDYETAHHYYEMLLAERDANKLDIFWYEELKIGIVYEKLGEKEKAQTLIKNYYEMAVQDSSYYSDIFLYGYYAYKGETNKAIEYLRKFSELDDFQYWFILFGDDPTDDSINDNPEVERLWQKVKDKFWANHNALKTRLEAQGLI